MRRVLEGDVVAAGRALAGLPPAERGEAARRLIAEADLADAHRRLTGRAHPRRGTGTLASAALRCRRAAPAAWRDPSFRGGVLAVLAALAERDGA